MDQSSPTPASSLSSAFRSPADAGKGRRICDLLRAQIASGALPTGARAPSTRALATDLGVSRTTVTAAYEQLAAEGFLVTAPGRVATVAGSPAADPTALADAMAADRAMPSALSAQGRRIADMVLPGLVPADPPRIDFLYGAVAARDFPTRVWQRAYQTELLRARHSLYYAPPEGEAVLRQALQGYLWRARGLSCDAERIVIVQGAQQGIDLCARLLLEAGDAFVFEDPGYLMARRCFEATGAVALPVPVDALGLDTASLPRDGRARLAYVTPSHQFPLGGVLPIGRRQALLAWARRHRAWVVEDDYDGEFRYGQRPIDALQSIDADGRVIYVGTFSKALSPQMRLGYLVLPAALVDVFRRARRLADRHAPLLEQRVLAVLIDGGAYERHVRAVRRANERRRAALLDAVARHLPGDAHLAGTAAGLHAVLWLPSLRSHDEPRLIGLARGMGLGVHPVAPLFAAPPGDGTARPCGLILGYASLTPDRIEEGVRLLAAALGALSSARPSSPPPPAGRRGDRPSGAGRPRWRA